MAVEKKGEITLSYGTLLLYWDTENYKMLCILKVSDHYIGTFKTCLSIEKDLSDSKTFSEILTYGFGAKNRYDSLGNLLSWLNRTDDFSITAIFRKPLKDEIAVVHDKKEDAKIAELNQKSETLDLRFRKNDYFANLYSGQTIDSPERMKYEEIKRHTEGKQRQNDKDKEDVQKMIDVQEGVIARLKDNAITSALMFDVLYKPVISGNLEYLLESMVPMYRNAEQSIKAKLQQFGLKTTEIKDFNIAVSLFVPSLFNPEYYKGVSHPAAQAFSKTLKDFYEAYLADDIKHEGYSLSKQYAPAVIFEQILTSNVNKPENVERIHIPDPRMFHYNKGDLLYPIGFVAKSIIHQKVTNIPVNLRVSDLSRSVTLLGLQGFGKSLGLQTIGNSANINGVKVLMIDPHGTLGGIYKKLQNAEARAELKNHGFPLEELEEKGLIPAKGRIYTVLSDDGLRFSTKLLANPIPDSITDEYDRRAIAQMYAHPIFTELMPNYCKLSQSNMDFAILQDYCVERFVRGEDVSLFDLQGQIRDAKTSANFNRILDLAPVIDSSNPTSIRKILEEDGLSTILLNKLNVYGSPEVMDMVFLAIFGEVHKYSQSLDYETNKTERILIADELGVLGRKNANNEKDFIGIAVREDRKRGTGYVLGSQRSVHISPSARSTNMKIYFRTTLENDIKTLKAQYPATEDTNCNDVSLISKLPRGYVFADLGSDFYSQPLFLKLFRPPCQHTGLTATEIREMMAKYKEDAPQIKFELLSVEDRIMQKVKELNSRNVKPSKNMVCKELGGMKERVLNAINALITERLLSYDTQEEELSYVRTAQNQSNLGGNYERG